MMQVVLAVAAGGAAGSLYAQLLCMKAPTAVNRGCSHTSSVTLLAQVHQDGRKQQVIHHHTVRTQLL